MVDNEYSALSNLFAKQVEKGSWNLEEVPSQLKSDVYAILEKNKETAEQEGEE